MNTLQYLEAGRVLCVACPYGHQDQPELVTCYYPIMQCSPSNAATFALGAELVRDCNGDYFYRDGSLPKTRFSLVDRGVTKAVLIKRTPIHAPKVRKGIELRWNCGRWEKLLRKGWVPA
jgi:hypothetical protein